MRIAIPTWQGTVSPVFDVARSLLLADVEPGGAMQRHQEPLGEGHPLARVRHLQELSVDVLLCGAVSAPVEQMLVAAGVRVIPYLCGPVDGVLQAFLSDRLRGRAFLMPGCGRRRHGRAGGRGGGRHGRPWTGGAVPPASTR